MSARDYILYTAIAVAVVAGVMVYVLEFGHINRTLDFRSLAFRALGLGLLLGLLLGRYFSRRLHDEVEVMQAYAAFVIGSLLLAPLAASLSNRLLDWQPAAAQSFTFEKEEPFVSSRFGFIASSKPALPTGHYLFVYDEQYRLHRLTMRQAQFAGTPRGSSIRLLVKPGFWGWQRVLGTVGE